MTPDWTHLPRWAPVLDTIAEELRPSDIMNFLVAIGYDPPENWRRTYLELYRELPGLVPWIDLSMKTGCTVSLVGPDVRKLIMYVHNSVKYPLRSDEPLVIWPVSTLPWMPSYGQMSDGESEPWLMTIPHNPLDGKLGVVRVKNRREPGVNYAKGTLNDGCAVEPPHEDITSIMLHSEYMLSRPGRGHVFNGLSGNPYVLLIGGVLDYNWPFPVLSVRNTLGQEIEPPILESEWDLVKTHIYCCNNSILYHKPDISILRDYSEEMYNTDSLSEIRDNQMLSKNCSNVDVICLRVLNIRPLNERCQFRDWGYHRALSMVLPSVCEVKRDLPPVAPNDFVKELTATRRIYAERTGDRSFGRRKYPLVLRNLVDAVLKKYSDYII